MIDPISLRTEDGVRLSAVRYRPDPGTPGVSGACFVVAHGFTGSTRRPALRAICLRLARRATVLAVDLRGHGRSGGHCTMGADEVLDVAAAVDRAYRDGHRQVMTVGFSMGGSVVLRHAALFGQVHAVASVSAPSRWYILDTVPMRRVHWLCETPLGRLVAARAFGTRIGSGWPEVPESPIELVGRIPPTPLLLVHGDRDAYFPLEHPRALAAAAGPDCDLWIERGYGHAEGAATPDLIDRIGHWLFLRGQDSRSGTIPA